MSIPRMLTVTEVAAHCRGPVSSVRGWIYAGKLRSRKVGRRRLVAEADLLQFLEHGTDGEAAAAAK